MGSARWGIALSGGGVLGAAHLGVLQALADAGLAPPVCVGTSAGGLVAGSLAAGLPLGEVRSFFAHVCAAPRWYELEGLWAEIRSSPHLGVVSLAPVLEQLCRAATSHLSSWRPGYAVMTVDLGSGSLLTLDSASPGSWTTAAALQATSAIPGLLAPVFDASAGLLCVDGGLQDDLPTAAAFAAGAGRVIAVNVGGALPPPPLPAKLGVAELLQRAAAYGTARLTADTNAALPGPVLPLRPALPAVSIFDFASFSDLYQAGYSAASAQRGAIEAFLGAEDAGSPAAAPVSEAVAPPA